MAKRKLAAAREILGEGHFVRLVRDGRWEFAERNNCQGVVAVIAVTAEDQLILTEQFRPAVGKLVIDIAAGLSGDEPGQQDEELALSAQRELLEETGYVAKKLVHVADCPSSPGLTNEIFSYFVARKVQKQGTGGGVSHEQITVHTPAVATISRWLKRQVKLGKLIDPKVYAALYFVLKSRS
ncbi:NUDIX hydrolase [bacterium]|nr:NUDIX hydrolase [bacterium]